MKCYKMDGKARKKKKSSDPEVFNQKKYMQYLFNIEDVTVDDAMHIFAIRNNRPKPKTLTHETKINPLTPRERRRRAVEKKRKEMLEKTTVLPAEAKMIKIIASMVPDEIIYNHEDYKPRAYQAALFFADVSGFTDMCERYTKTGKGGTSRLTQVLNSYIGAMVQEILSHNGDLLKFSGDAFLAMWKSSPTLSMQDAVHAAIDCAIIIQRDYGVFKTDVGVVLKVKVAIAGGDVLFTLIGNDSNSHYAVLGQPVWDVKRAEYLSQAGDVIASPSAWQYVNPVQYITKPMIDGVHTKILGIGATWKHVDKLSEAIAAEDDAESSDREFESDSNGTTVQRFSQNIQKLIQSHSDKNVKNLRRSVNFAIQNKMMEPLRKFMLPPVMKAIENGEPMEYLTEMRHVVIVFLNIITEHIAFGGLIKVLDKAFREVCRLVEDRRGILNKVSLFDKDMMFLIVFGLRGLKHELETQFALNCALEMRETLTKHDNIKSVSIGVTTGLAYCGVVGHTLRREYTVIALCVNKGARLMVAYPDKVTCDKETFLQSKLKRDHFTLMEPKVLKGLTNVGPIYEFRFNNNKSPTVNLHHLIVGRDKELLQYTNWMHRCLDKERYPSSDSQLTLPFPNILVIKGEAMIGKTRLLEEIINITPKAIKTCKLLYDPDSKVERYNLLNNMMISALNMTDLKCSRSASLEEKIYKLLGKDPIESRLCSINELCDVNFSYTFAYYKLNNEEKAASPVNVLKAIFNKIFPTLCIFMIDQVPNVDDLTWSVMSEIVSSDNLAMVMCVDRNRVPRSQTLKEITDSPTTLKIDLIGLDRWHHSTLVCQMLNVQAIPPELEKVIQAYSQGIPGWIENFLLTLVQGEQLYIKSMTCDMALEMGAVIPHNSDIIWLDDSDSDSDRSDSSIIISSKGWDIFKTSYRRVNDSKINRDSNLDKTISVAMLHNTCNFDGMESEMTMDLIFLKTYDSLNPFEQLLLKCSSILGEIFSRVMLMNVLQVEGDRRVANAIVKLFDIGFLKCAGGDFTNKQRGVLIKTLPQNVTVDPIKRCRCIGLIIQESNKDLPIYAWCGYIRFCNTLFFGATYDLLTENQKKDFHSRAVVFLEKNTRKCHSCGEGSFNKLLGIRKDVCSRADEARISAYYTKLLDKEFHLIEEFTDNKKDSRNKRKSTAPDLSEFNVAKCQGSYMMNKASSRLRSYVTLNFTECECEMILAAMYTQIIEHCKKSDQIYKLIEAYIELAELNINSGNIPLAMGLLCDVEEFVKSPKFVLLENSKEYIEWQMKFVLGRIYSARGRAMLDFGDATEAKTYLYKAMNLFDCPFPNTKYKRGFKSFLERIKRILNIKLPRLLKGNVTGIKAIYLEQISETLGHLFKLFKMPQKESWSLAYLAALWSLNLALRSNANFSLLCIAYGNMMTACQFYHQESLCHIIETPALELCSKKGENLDLLEMDSIAHLYSSIFMFRIFSSEITSGIELGYTMLGVMDKGKQRLRRSIILLWLNNMLCAYKRFIDAVGILGQLKMIQQDQDVTCKAWYYAKALDIHLDTGYTVEPYTSCIKFFLEEGETIRSAQNPEAGWQFFIAIWLRNLRSNSFAAAAVWDEKVKMYINQNLRPGKSINRFTSLRLMEGLLHHMVLEMNAKQLEKYKETHRTVKKLRKIIKAECRISNIYMVRYILMNAYYRYITKNDAKVFKHLEKGLKLATKIGHLILMEWYIHIKKAWSNKISILEKDGWMAHCDVGTEINYREIELNQRKLMLYTLPSPINRF